MLELAGVTKRFGGVAALSNVSFTVAEGEILGLIGPNGAGKTTLLNCISGVYRLDGGSITFDGRRLDHDRPHRARDAGGRRRLRPRHRAPHGPAPGRGHAGRGSPGPPGHRSLPGREVRGPAPWLRYCWKCAA